MSRLVTWMKPKEKRRHYDIHYGADINDIEEIAGALRENFNVLNEQEPLTGKTALIVSAADGNFLALHFLLVTHKADPFIKDKKDWQALDYARAIGHQGCRQLLLEHMFPDLNDDTGSPDVVRLRPR